jgi:hypothetical protein
MIGANTVETDWFDLLLKSGSVALLRRQAATRTSIWLTGF